MSIGIRGAVVGSKVRTWSWLLLLGCAACISDDNDPPTLSFDLYWQESGRQYGDNTCDSAHVGSMDWQLLDGDGKVLVENPDDNNGHRCHNGFTFTDLGLGDYTLKVTGYDSDHNRLWTASCEGTLDRFDRAEGCKVYLLSTRPDHGDDTDAGT